ncbi:MAG: hypothetical protein ABIQ74_03180 [Chitinophagales bacterium]
MTFTEEFEELLRAFKKFNVDYMLVGAYALNFHGYNRSTSDLDVWAKSSVENQNKINDALRYMGFAEKGLKQLMSLDFNKSFIFSVGEKPRCVEIFNSITGVKYEDAEKHKISFEFANGLVVDFIEWRDLVINKLLTGRLKDQADVEELQKIINLKWK